MCGCFCACVKSTSGTADGNWRFAGISRTNSTSGLQRLTMKGFLKIEEVKEPKPSRKSKAAGEVQGKAEKPETRRKDRKTKVTVTILPTAEAVMKELALAQRDYDEARFVGFTEEELIKIRRSVGENKRKYKEDSGIIFLRPINITQYSYECEHSTCIR